jgi:quinol monooxygenase YgiN
LPSRPDDAKNAGMNYPANVVSIHPYFKVRPGRLGEFKALLPAFVKATTAEPANLFYEFTVNGDEVFCREAYVGAAGVLAHLANISALLGEALKIAELTRLELHGPAAELDQLRGALAAMQPAWFVLECGVRR